MWMGLQFFWFKSYTVHSLQNVKSIVRCLLHINYKVNKIMKSCLN